MNEKEIFNELINSSRFKELIGANPDEHLDIDFNSSSKIKEVAIIRNMIEGYVRHTSDDNIFKNIIKFFDL